MLKRREFMGTGAALGAAAFFGCDGGTATGDDGAGGSAASGGSASGGVPGSGGESTTGLGGFAGSSSCGSVDAALVTSHPHTLTITPEEVLLGVAHYYTVEGDHTHGLSLSAEEFEALSHGETLTKMTGEGGYGEFTHRHEVTLSCLS